MKWMQVIGTVILLITLMGCEENDIHAEYEKKLYKSKKQVEKQEKLPIELTESEARFLLDDLMALVDGHYSYDKLHRTVHMTIGEDEFYLIDDVPVIEKNGEYIPTEDIYLIIEKQHDESEKIYLPAEFIEVALQTSLQHEDGHAFFHWPTPAKRVGGPPPSFEMDQWGVEEMVSYLSFLQKPLQEAEVSTISGHLPGAPRPYRNGFHEGIDWYGYATGAEITMDTPIYAMAEGVVVRADHDFIEYESPEMRNEDLAYTKELGETPEYIFDRLRGRQVWIQYDHGVMNRFAHLSDIPNSIAVGDKVDENTIIGYIGNSGTSGAVNKDLSELHLHQDLLIYGEFFWQYLSEEEVLQVLEQLWGS